MNKYYLSFLFFTAILLNLHSSELSEVVILQTTDIHSHIFDKNSGWLRIASKIKQARKAAGGKNNTLLVDCGDTLTGSMSASVTQSKAAATMLNLLEYDAWVLGNHDFELGKKRLTELCRFIKADKFAGNLKWQPELIKQYRIYRKNGAKIALIGLTSPHLSQWLWGSDNETFQTKQLMETIDVIIPRVMKEKPNMIILATHHGRFSPARLRGIDITRIAEKYPQIDLILGGHSHQEVPGEKSGSNSWYTMAAPHGQSLMQINAKIDLEQRGVVELTSKIIPVSRKVAQDVASKEVLRKWQLATEKCKRQIIGTTNRRLKGAELNKIFGQALMYSSGAEAAFISKPVPAVELGKGKITEKDLFNVEPYDDTVCVLHLTKRQIQEVVAEQAEKRSMGRFQVFHFTQEKENAVDRIPVAFSSYILAGAGGRFPVLKRIAQKNECKGKNTGISIRDALRKYVRSGFLNKK